MNKNVFYHYFEHWGMRMGGCECAALDDAAHSFRFGKMPSIWPSWPGFCCWAPWAQLFMVEIVYLCSYNVFTHNTLIFTRLGDQEWMDGEGCCWMTFPIGKVIPNWAPFPTGLMGLGFL